MRPILRKLVVIAAFILAAQSAYSQYYSWGADRSSLKWSQFKEDSVRIIYPDSVEFTARRMMHYIDAVKDDISYGFEYPQLKVPFVVHPDNFVSNGMVMWAPLRIEFLSTPAVDNYSMPWIKQLVAHEYRHAVQYNNLDQSTLKVISYILGQQGAAASLLFPPLYALEGDAVIIETQMSTYGRGLQPSFSIGYRAVGSEILDKRDFLKWRCGSYRQAVPDHYRMGYQILSYANEKYGENILDGAFNYIARNPQFISPYSIALKKYYGTSTKELFYETFESLNELWEPFSVVENSAQILTPAEKNNVITYSSPMPLPDGTLLVRRSDYKDPSRFVIFDPSTAQERVLAHTGSVSTRAAYAAGRVWWTEYRRSKLFDEDIDSQLCYMDIDQRRPRMLKGHKSALYPTPIGDSADHIAYVEYDISGQYTVVELNGEEVISRTAVKFPNEVHSMAWDNLTERLYLIITGDEGMWIEGQSASGFEPITRPAYITISDLRAADGVLYFGSIASGKDEVHSFDIATGEERQLSESTFGSFGPVVDGDKLYMTTYDKQGYLLSSQSIDKLARKVDYSLTPKNILNPQTTKLDIINLDTVKFDLLDLEASKEKYNSKKYHKASHLFNIHSWAPISYDPFNILSEMTLDVGLGATIVSQNLLSSCEGFLSYGWDSYQGSVLKGGVNYDGLGVDMTLAATYGGQQNVYLIDSSGINLKNYCDLSFSASLPLFFSRGYHNRMFTAYAGWSYSNGIMPTGLKSAYVTDLETGEDKLTITYSDVKTGLNKFSMGLSYSSYVNSAYRDLTTPLGYTLSASYATDPFSSDFSDLISLYGKLFTPGLAKNNSFTLAASYQDAIGGFEIDGYYPLSYLSSILIPHGFSYLDISNNNYFSASAAYKFPLCYPEFDALWDLLYFKRLSLGFGADYAQFDYYKSPNSSIYSYGVDLIVDLNALSMTSASTVTTTFSFYKPQDRGLYFQFSLSLPF